MRILQDIYAEPSLYFQIRKHSGVLIDADQDEQRIERNRSEGIGGHAMNVAGLPLDGNYGYARRKVSHNAAELLGSQGD